VPFPRLLIDVQPLRESPAFRRLWGGSALSAVGGSMTSFAVTLQVFTLTHSSAAVGGVGLAAGAPAVVFGLIGGSIADALDRRKLVLVTSSCLAVVSAILTIQAFAGLTHVWPLYLLVAVQSLLGSIDVPARRTFTPRLLTTQQLPAATALFMLLFHATGSAGPLLAGAVTTVGGLKTCYLLDTISFAGALYGVARLPAMTTDAGAARPGLRAVGEGLRYIRTNQVLTGALVADLSATVLGMPFALFPAINQERFHGSAVSLGLLSASVAVGGILGSVFSGPVGKVSRQGAAMLGASAVWGAGLFGFGLAQPLWLAVLMLIIAGAGDVTSVVFRSTVIQTVTPDLYRGRTASAEYVIGSACPQLGIFRGGVLGQLTSPTVSAVSGGLSTVVAAGLISVALPALSRFRAPATATPTPAPARSQDHG
jgi:MFS family permease